MSDVNEFAELLWENGQAVVHGRRKQPQQTTAFPPFTDGGASSSSRKAQEKHSGSGDAVTRMKSGVVYGAAGGIGPSSAHDLCSGQDATRGNGDLDDTVPWIHYPIMQQDEDSAEPALADSYSPDFFSELQAAAAAAAGNLTYLPPSVQHTTNYRSTGAATSAREPDPSKESHRTSAPATRHEPQPEFASAKQPRLSGGGGDTSMNFSLFSRPAAMARASLQQSAQRPPPPLGTDKPSKSNVTVTASTGVESKVVQTSGGPRTAPVSADWPQGKELSFPCRAAPTTTTGIMQQELPHDRIGNMDLQRRVEVRKAPQVAASSVFSANDAGIGNDESWRQMKRKSQAECSASQDDDLEDEFGGLRRSSSRGTKRSRTAEVHNLSERRRRDRINEKMHVLQELIPHCNKIDKASMLDEAIEYLKTLQLQVQMMSMGSGPYIPPMLLPPAMQHLQIPPMAYFPHVGMGLGYGTGVFDMNSTTTVPLPPMSGAHFPCKMIPGAAAQGLGIHGRNTLPMFGVPGQPIHPSASDVQTLPSLASLTARPNLATQVSATVANMVQERQVSYQQQSLNDEGTQGASTGDPQLQTVLQVENQHLSVPSTQSENRHFLDGGSNRTNSAVRNGAEK